jgi:hypothetical protein
MANFIEPQLNYPQLDEKILNRQVNLKLMYLGSKRGLISHTREKEKKNR